MEAMRASLANYVRQEGHKIKLPPEEQLNINARFCINQSNINGSTVQRCTKVFLKPTLKQAKKLNKWFVINDMIYNMTVNYLMEYKNTKKPMIKEVLLRNNIHELIEDNYPKLKLLMQKYQFPSDTVNLCIEQVRISYDTARNVRKFHAFRIRRRKHDRPKKTMKFSAKAFSKKENVIFPMLLGLKHDKDDFEVQGLDVECNVQWNKRGKYRYTLFVPEDRLIQQPVARKPSCALDPGSAVFQTLYDGDRFIKIAEDTRARVQLQYNKLEKVKNFEQKTWYKRFSDRIWDKIKHIIEDVHKKTSTWLCRNYSEINIGKISTSSILKKEGLAPKHKKMLQQMSHFKFRQILKEKAVLYCSTVNEIHEAYTSKMCGNCAELNVPNSNRLYSCKCGFEINRDFNGARNISFRRAILL